jgi:hypothetical protein
MVFGPPGVVAADSGWQLPAGAAGPGAISTDMNSTSSFQTSLSRKMRSKMTQRNIAFASFFAFLRLKES